MEVLVGNSNTYEKLDTDPTHQYRSTIMAKLLPMQSYLPAPLFHRLSPSTTANPPLMFGQPKVHKEGLPLRPIVSCRNTIFAEVTRECGRILGPLVGKTAHHIKDSVDLVAKLRDITIPPDFTICSFDLKDKKLIEAWGCVLAAVWPLVTRGSTHNAHDSSHRCGRRGVAQLMKDAVRVDAAVSGRTSGYMHI